MLFIYLMPNQEFYDIKLIFNRYKPMNLWKMLILTIIKSVNTIYIYYDDNDDDGVGKKAACLNNLTYILQSNSYQKQKEKK